jgi:poly(3-hydroxybutyrate) depolymerase
MDSSRRIPTGPGPDQGFDLERCDYAVRNKIGDVGFSKALLDDLATRAHVDRTRVYATGYRMAQ